MEYTVNMYISDDIFEGMHGNVITGTAARVAAYSMDPLNSVRVSFDHVHPEDAWDNKFSRGIIGDELVARWPTVGNAFVGDVETGNLLVFNEAKPSTLFKRQEEIDYEDEGYNFKLAGNLPKINP